MSLHPDVSPHPGEVADQDRYGDFFHVRHEIDLLHAHESDAGGRDYDEDGAPPISLYFFTVVCLIPNLSA